MSKKFLRAWAKDRGVKTFLQVFFGVLILNSLPGAFSPDAYAVITPAELAAMPWLTALTTAAFVTFGSFAMALANPEFVIGDDEDK